MSHYDLIVVGAGNGGLSAASMASVNGLKTLVLERHNLPGGSATSFVRGRFEFESALHELCDLGTPEQPGAVRNMFAMFGADVGWHNEQNLFRLIVPGNIDVVLPAGQEAFLDKMEEEVPGCRESLEQVLHYGKIAQESMAYLNSGAAEPKVLFEEYPDFLRMVSLTTQEGLDLLGVPERAAHIIETYWCYLGATQHVLDFMTFACMIYKYVEGKPGLPSMKSHELSLALEKVIRNHGGDIWYNSEVFRIIIEKDTAKGVILADGQEIRADHVIANVSPHMLMGQMLAEDVDIPEYPLKLANARSLALGLETMYVGLNRSAAELGIKDYSTLIMADEDPEVQLAKSGGIGKGTFIANCLNTVIPDSSPEGTCTLFFTTFSDNDFWSSLSEEEYFKAKEAHMKDWVEYYEKVTGIQIAPYIEEITFASPVSFVRYLNTPKGTPYGYQVFKWDGIVERSNSSEDEQIFRNLRLTGAACENIDGYNLCYMNGVNAAKKTIMDKRKEGK